jgi:hypothetical protein
MGSNSVQLTCGAPLRRPGGGEAAACSRPPGWGTEHRGTGPCRAHEDVVPWHHEDTTHPYHEDALRPHHDERAHAHHEDTTHPYHEVAGEPSPASETAPHDAARPGWRTRRTLVETAVALVLLVVIGVTAAGKADANRRAEHETARAAAAEATARRGLEDELAARQAKLTALSHELDQRAAELASGQAAVNQQPSAPIADGLFEVGTDMAPGKYRTEGSAGCYWARLNSSNSMDLIDNGLNNGPQTVIVTSGWFESQSCGTWQKVG